MPPLFLTAGVRLGAINLLGDMLGSWVLHGMELAASQEAAAALGKEGAGFLP